MILQPTTSPQSPLNRVLCYLAGFLGTGAGLILLNSLYEAVSEYNALIMRVLTFGIVVLILSVVAYISVSIILTIEYRATENKIFKESRQQFIPSSEENSGQSDDKEEKILSLYDEMAFTNSLSYNQIAVEVFGGKSGVYTKQIKEILVKNGREI